MRRFEQFRANRPPAVSGVGRAEHRVSTVFEFDEASVLDDVRLGLRDRKDHSLAKLFVLLKKHFDHVAIWRRYPAFHFWDRRETRRRIHGYASVRRYGAGPERQRRNMPLSDSAKAQDESAAILCRAGLVWVADKARMERGGRREGGLVGKVRPDQSALRL